MLELTGVASILRGMGILYWVLAIGALGLVLWKVKRRWHKALGVLAVVGLFGFLPAKSLIQAKKRNDYAREAWAYFKKLCDEKSGEKIYKTFTGVKSVLVVKPLPPASDKDHFDQFWYGDPYSASATSVRTDLAASTLAWSDGPISRTERGCGFDFVESVTANQGDPERKFVKYSYPKGARTHISEPIDSTVSRFGISWEDISTPDDRKYWIAGSRLRVIDLSDNSIVAERIGYFIEAGFGSTAGQRRPWLTSRGPTTTCPEAHDYADRWFLLKALRPIEESNNGK
jgi:hypothetical protein